MCSWRRISWLKNSLIPVNPAEMTDFAIKEHMNMMNRLYIKHYVEMIEDFSWAKCWDFRKVPNVLTRRANGLI